MQIPNYLLDENDITNAMNRLGIQDQYIIRSITGNNFDSLAETIQSALTNNRLSRFMNIAYNTGANSTAGQSSGFAKAGHWVAIRLDTQTGQYQIADSLPNQARLQQIQQDMQQLGFQQQFVLPSYNQNDGNSCGAYTALNLLDMQNSLNAPSRSEADARQFATQIMNYYSNAQGIYNSSFPLQSVPTQNQGTQRQSSSQPTPPTQNQGTQTQPSSQPTPLTQNQGTQTFGGGQLFNLYLLHSNPLYRMNVNNTTQQSDNNLPKYNAPMDNKTTVHLNSVKQNVINGNNNTQINCSIF